MYVYIERWVCTNIIIVNLDPYKSVPALWQREHRRGSGLSAVRGGGYAQRLYFLTQDRTTIDFHLNENQVRFVTCIPGFDSDIVSRVHTDLP